MSPFQTEGLSGLLPQRATVHASPQGRSHVQEPALKPIGFLPHSRPLHLVCATLNSSRRIKATTGVLHKVSKNYMHRSQLTWRPGMGCSGKLAIYHWPVQLPLEHTPVEQTHMQSAGMGRSGKPAHYYWPVQLPLEHTPVEY